MRIVNALVLADDPLRVSVQGSRRASKRMHALRYQLDDQRLRGALLRGAGRKQSLLLIGPRALARVGAHVLRLRLKPRHGRARSARLRLQTVGCDAVFRAYQRRSPGGSTLRLRLDARESIGAASFKVPARMLPKHVVGMRAGRLRLVARMLGRRGWTLRFSGSPGAGVVLQKASTPSVVVRGGSVAVNGLPAGTGIVEVQLRTRRPTRPRALLKPGRAARLRAQIAGESPQLFAYKLRGKPR